MSSCTCRISLTPNRLAIRVEPVVSSEFDSLIRRAEALKETELVRKLTARKDRILKELESSRALLVQTLEIRRCKLGKKHGRID